MSCDSVIILSDRIVISENAVISYDVHRETPISSTNTYSWKVTGRVKKDPGGWFRTMTKNEENHEENRANGATAGTRTSGDLGAATGANGITKARATEGTF